MPQAKTMSSSGAPMYKYHKPSRSGGQIIENNEVKAVLEKHIKTHFPNEHSITLPDRDPYGLRVDILHLEATEDRPFHIFITAGMSSVPMTQPDGGTDAQYAEIMTMLPQKWDIKNEERETNTWPINWMRHLAVSPYIFRTWIWIGHTVPNNDPPQPFTEDTGFCGTMLMPSSLFSDEVLLVPYNKNSIAILTMVPLYKEEMDFKLEYGADALFEKFKDNLGGPSELEIIDPTRTNVCKRKKIFGMF